MTADFIGLTIDRLARLRVLDSQFRVFGADKHRYAFRPVPEDEILKFETWCGCPLPGDYRDFIARIGVGAGPAYGLWSFAEIQKEWGYIAEDHLAEFGKEGGPSAPFGLEAEILRARESPDGAKEVWKAPETPGGFIPICHLGCEFLNVMAITGASAGTVLHTTAFATFNSEWCCARRPRGIVRVRMPDGPPPPEPFPAVPYFADWITGWLDSCFWDLTGGGAG